MPRVEMGSSDENHTGSATRRAWGLACAALCAIALASGCTSPREWWANGWKVGPQYCDPGAMVGRDWIDGDDRRVIRSPADHAAWWATFNDPLLNEFVAQAYQQNLTLREAGARIIEARALRDFAVGNFFPQRQDVSASYSHNLSTGTGPNRHFSVWNGSFNFAWELDFWGRYRRAVEASDADLQATVFEYGDVVVTLVADVAATYVDIRTLQKQLELVRDNEENQRKTYELILERFNAGDLSDVDVQQAKSSLAQTEAFVPQLEIALRQSQNALCVLLGMPPEDLAARLGRGEIPNVGTEVAVGIPAETLMRRPDVRRAERRLAAQSARIGVAESDWYPGITLSGGVGVSANQFGDLFRNGSSFGSIGPSLRWNILNYGRILANVEVQDARFQQLLANYRQTVLLANLEAENAIIQFLKSQERLESQLEAAEAANKTNDLINLQLEVGEADINRVFNVQNFKTQQEQNAATAKGDVAQNLISIYRAVGGGWPSPFLGQPVLQPPSVEEVPAGAPQADGDEPADGGLGLPLENGDNAPAEGEDLPAPDEPLAFPKSVAPLPPVSQSSLRPPKASAAS
ncbi:MAG: transporter [Planctomycetaceae bacterium]|nr:transporter [Planctomycetaceae bacterium]